MCPSAAWQHYGFSSSEERGVGVKGEKKITFETVAFYFVLISLLASAIYSLINVVSAPTVLDHSGEIEKIKNDYVLMLAQCVLGILVILLPSAVEKRWKIQIPSFMHILFTFFLYASIFLGEITQFYYKIPNWDTILHTLSGMMLGTVAFSVVSLLNQMEKITLRPLFVAIFAFCFGLALGVVWEIYEFLSDGAMGLNMQKYALADGTLLIGRAALNDTMVDLIVDALGAFTMAAIGYISLKFNKGWIDKLLFKKKK